MSHRCKRCDNYDIICQPGCKATFTPDIGNVCGANYNSKDVKSHDYYNKCMGYEKKDILGNTPGYFWKRSEYKPKFNKNINMNPLSWTGYPPHYDPPMFPDKTEPPSIVGDAVGAVGDAVGAVGSLFESFSEKSYHILKAHKNNNKCIIFISIFLLIIMFFFNR